MTDDNAQTGSAWWERLTDSSGDEESGKRIIKIIAIAAVVTLAAFAAWTFMDNSKKESNNERAEILEQGLLLLPDRLEVNFGIIGDRDLRRDGGRQTMASAFLRGDHEGRDSSVGAFSDPEVSAAYKDEVEKAIQAISDRAGEFDDKEWKARYLHTLQQLHYYAALNTADKAGRVDHLNKQIALLDELAADHADNGILGMKPLPSQAEKSVLDLYREAADAELAFCNKFDLSVTLKPDNDLKAVVELDNGKTIELEFYSRVAPKAVMNFLFHANAGHYDGTAFHKLDAQAGTLVGGGLFSKDFADRPYAWGTENPGYTMTSESSGHLPTKAGVVALDLTGTANHGLYFKIYTVDPDVETTNDTVFAKITKGLDSLDEWMSTEVHDFAGLANKQLPRARLGIKKVTISGKQQHPSLDSWTPPTDYSQMKPAPLSPAEQAFMDSLKAPEKDEEENSDKEKSSEADGDK